MPLFTYTVFDARGEEQHGTLEAGSADEAAGMLRARGLFPAAVREAGSVAETGAGRSWAWAGRRASRRDVAVFLRQLATLLRAGLPLVRALEVLGRQGGEAALRGVVGELAERLRAGGSLAEAMAAHPRVFSTLDVSMVRAGEASGALDAVLERLAHFAEKSLQLRGRIRTALIYPAVVLAVAGGILATLLAFVVPRFQQIFADLLKGAPLPPLTQAVLDLSGWVRDHWLAGFGVGLLLALLGPVVLRTARGRRGRDAVLRRVPVLGNFLVKAAVARGTRTLGTLLASGVPILPALLIAREVCGQSQVADELARVHERVKAGEPVARPLAEGGVFPPLVSSLVDVGEQSGQLPAMLARVADIYEEEVDQAAAGLGAALEPVLILFLALVVGVIVIALFLPIVRIVQLLS